MIERITAFVVLFCFTFGSSWTVTILISFVLFTLFAAYSLSVLGNELRVNREAELRQCPKTQNPLYSKARRFPFGRGIPSECKKFNIDKRITGSGIIDTEINDVLDNVISKYVTSWYDVVFEKCDNEDAFSVNLRNSVNKILVSLSSCCKEADFMQYFTTTIVNDFATHVRVFKEAKKRMNVKADDKELINKFFESEEAVCGLNRKAVCCEKEKIEDYFMNLTEYLLYLLADKEDFNCKILRELLKELVSSSMWIPMVQKFCDPSYVNEIFLWVLEDVECDVESFLLVVRSITNTEELESLKERVEDDMQLARSNDCNSERKAHKQVKAQLQSLEYLNKLIQHQIKEVEKRKTSRYSPENAEASNVSSFLDWQKLVPIQHISLKELLVNNIALSFFIDYMQTKDMVHLVFFHLTVEGFRITAIQELSNEEDKSRNESSKKKKEQLLRESALNIFDQYLSEKALHPMGETVGISFNALRNLKAKITSEAPSYSWFNDAQERVFFRLNEEFFPSFRESERYYMMLAELGLMQNVNDSSEIDLAAAENTEHPSPANSLPTVHNLSDYTITIIDSEERRDSQGAKYTVYQIEVIRELAGGGGRSWVTFRRYSEFHDLHCKIQRQFPNLIGLSFPGKELLSSNKSNVVEKRKKALAMYLKTLLFPDVLSNNKGLFELLILFLAPGDYRQTSSSISKAISSVVHPLKKNLKSIGHGVISIPNNVLDNLGTFISQGSRSSSMSGEISQQYAFGGSCSSLTLDNGVSELELKDNIPLRIMLLLMDEIFDLGNKNQWLRARIVVILSSILRAAFGDSMNRKITEFVQSLFSHERIALYIRTIKRNMWPKTMPLPVSGEDKKRSSVLARTLLKAKILSLTIDEIQKYLGFESVKRGSFMLFDMFQNENINRRLFIVILEGCLQVIFPANRISQRMKSFHSVGSKREAE